MNTFGSSSEGIVTSPATVIQLVVIPKAYELNGVISIYSTDRPPPNIVLFSDSFLGVVSKVDIITGEYEIAANETSMKPIKGGTEFFGINELKVQDGCLYYTKSGSVTFWRVSVGEDGIVPSDAKAELILDKVKGDNFAIDAENISAYVADTLVTNVLYRVDLQNGDTKIIAGIFNSKHSPIKTPTAVQFGRGWSDWRSIYVTTDGGATAPRSWYARSDEV